MTNLSRFVIHNDLAEPAILNLEPENLFVTLRRGDDAVVVDEDCSHPVTIKLGKSEEGGLLLSIWPGDGEVRVEIGGVNVLDEPAEGAPSESGRSQRVPKPAASS